MPRLAPRFVVEVTHPMWRMQLDVAAFSPPALTGVEPLTPADVDAIRELYADGDAAGEAPDFFAPSMLDAGLFFGVREAGTLVAAAGPHIVAPDMGICAIGNVYTRRDRRGRGHGQRVTAAVAAGARALRRRNQTVAATPSAKDYTRGERMYGLVNGRLAWLFEMEAMGQPLQNHLAIELRPAADMGSGEAA